MDFDLTYPKFKILFVNIFIMLYKAATLSPTKLQLNLKEVKFALRNTSPVPLLQQLIIFSISLFLIGKTVFGFFSLASTVIAIFPILSDEHPELLLPTIIAQAIESILLSLIELLLGYITVKFYITGKTFIFALFVTKMLIKMTLNIFALSIYSDLYNNLIATVFTADLSDISQDSDLFEHVVKQERLG